MPAEGDFGNMYFGGGGDRKMNDRKVSHWIVGTIWSGAQVDEVLIGECVYLGRQLN